MWLDDERRRADLEQEFVKLHLELKRDAELARRARDPRAPARQTRRPQAT